MTDEAEDSNRYWTSTRVIFTALGAGVALLVLAFVVSSLVAANNERQREDVQERLDCVTEQIANASNSSEDEDC